MRNQLSGVLKDVHGSLLTPYLSSNLATLLHVVTSENNNTWVGSTMLQHRYAGT
jgi:hypothetical protein